MVLRPGGLAQARPEGVRSEVRRTTFASLVDLEDGTALKFVAPLEISGQKSAKIGRKDIEGVVEYWFTAVICGVIRANPPLEVVDGFVHPIWVYLDIDKVLLAWRGGLAIEDVSNIRGAMNPPPIANILAWNVRGLNRPNKQEDIKIFLHKHSIDLVALLGTKAHLGNAMVLMRSTQSKLVTYAEAPCKEQTWSIYCKLANYLSAMSQGDETHDHLFFHCAKAKEIWTWMGKWLAIPSKNTWHEWIHYLLGIKTKKVQKQIIYATFAAVKPDPLNSFKKWRKDEISTPNIEIKRSETQHLALITRPSLFGHDESSAPHSICALSGSRPGHLSGGTDFVCTSCEVHALLLLNCIRFVAMMICPAKVFLLSSQPPFTICCYLLATMSNDLNSPSFAHGSPSGLDMPIPSKPLDSPSRPNTENPSAPLYPTYQSSSGACVVPPSSNDKGKAVLIEAPSIPDDKSFEEPILVGVPVSSVDPGSVPLLPYELFPPITSSTYLSGTSFVATQVLSPTSPLDAAISPSPEGDSGSPNFGNAMDFEDGSDMYLELEDPNKPLPSTESSKKQKIEDGDKCSSYLAN
ncbi:hypothetical protein Cgig2_015473 [Carnegiea gigantea]|uniref:Uncharacterized protein n=1 Tax=Carnegiea gigantea TaxID=171969 RepID=A0A9Q1GK36_9CARY|nr:hypothetical protein Cgig2_015473 [Carnegiea gigantea]